MTNIFRSFHFTFQEVGPNLQEILSLIKSEDLEEEHPAVVFIKDILPELQYNSGITGGYILKSIQSSDSKKGIIEIDSVTLNTGKQIGTYLKGSTHCALFLCTAGEDFTGMTNQLNEQGDIMEAYILDAIGSITVEKAMDKIQRHLQHDMLQNGLAISNRYSPGYCNWPLSEQQHLFQLIGANPVGIALNDSSLMTPRKSVSGLIGIGIDVKKREYGCITCSNSDCIYRRIIHE